MLQHIRTYASNVPFPTIDDGLPATHESFAIHVRNGGDAVAGKRVDFKYNASGQFDKLSRYAGTTASELAINSFYRYDDAGRLAKLVHTMSATAPPACSSWGTGVQAGYRYPYDDASRITAMTSYWDNLGLIHL